MAPQTGSCCAVQTPEQTDAAGQPASIQPRLVSTNLKNARGTWVRLCSRWFFTGIAARQTSIEAARK